MTDAMSLTGAVTRTASVMRPLFGVLLSAILIEGAGCAVKRAPPDHEQPASPSPTEVQPPSPAPTLTRPCPAPLPTLATVSASTAVTNPDAGSKVKVKIKSQSSAKVTHLARSVPHSGNPSGNGLTPKELPDGNDDDIVARRLRQAAQQEKNSELKGKLWREYVEYKSNVRAK